jgi:hypothetical protein
MRAFIIERLIGICGFIQEKKLNISEKLVECTS